MSNWSAPAEKSWSVNEMANATNLNKYQRDNVNASMATRVYKSEDEIFNGTGLHDDKHLFMPMLANETWLLRISVVWYDDYVGTFGRFTMGFSYPTGVGVISMSAYRHDPGANAQADTYVASGDTFVWQTVGASTETNQDVVVEGRVVNGSTNGLFRVRWAQSVAVGTNCIVRKGSMIQGMKM